MLHHHEIYPDLGLLVEAFSGVVTTEEIARCVRLQHESPDFESVRWVVTDCRRATGVDAEVSDIMGFATDAFHLRARYAGKRWAFLQNDPQNTAMAMIFQNAMRGHVDFEIFSTLDAALAWLGTSEDVRRICEDAG